jgi:hypothetical protein
MVPKLVPVDVDTRQQMRKLVPTKAVPESFRLPATHTSASTKPVALSSTPMIDARDQAVIMIMTMGRDMPSITTSQKAVRSRARSRLSMSARTSTGQKPLSSGAPESASATTPTTNNKKGVTAPKLPP